MLYNTYFVDERATNPCTEEASEMQKTEYQMVDIILTDEGSFGEQIVARLNELGQEGWQVSGINLADHPAWADRTVHVLLERVVQPAETRTTERELVGAART